METSQSIQRPGPENLIISTLSIVRVFTSSIIRWYDAPTGGNLLFTGNYFKVSPSTTRTYYASAGYECEYPVRKQVKAIVNQCLSVRKTAGTSPELLECYPNPTSGIKCSLSFLIWLQVAKSISGKYARKIRLQ
ncbi:hypothetical protein [Chitinophaga varians]|uniref:immunoglobulin domain-containing protein n=1 Tax=Chitinophaga varians TaxID=2202339 RepID=UPI003977477A